MNIRHIELFQAILQTGTLTAAADLLHISQPAASKLLQHAEQQLGFALFYRIRGKLEATPEAKILQQKAERLSVDLQSIRRLANSLQRNEERTLHLICIPALAQEIIPFAIKSWRQHYPKTPCELATQHTQEIIQALLFREADIGLTLQAVEHPGLDSRCLIAGYMQVIAPSGWWSESELEQSIGYQELTHVPLIGLDMNDALAGLIRSHIQEFSVAPTTQTWVQTYQLARSLVCAGEGLAIVDPLTAHMKTGGAVQARRLEPSIIIPLYQLTRAGEPIPSSTTKLIQQVTDYIQSLLPHPTL